MKLDQLRKIIREEVRAAVKEELQEMLTEAVKIASEPSTPSKQKFEPVTQKNLDRKWSVGKMNKGTVPLEEMLQQTQASMTATEYSNIVGGSGAQKPNFASSMATQMGMTENSGPMPGIDISKLDFVSKAKKVLDKSYEKDRSR